MTCAYAVVFGALMLALAAVADRVGQRRVMLLGAASLATAFVTTAEQLVAIRVLTGVAAAMTTPGAMALAFRLFDDDTLRMRAITQSRYSTTRQAGRPNRGPLAAPSRTELDAIATCGLAL